MRLLPPPPPPFGNPSQVLRGGPFYKRTRGTCTLFALNFFRGIFCCPSANAAYAQQCLAALIFRSILLRAARFVLEQLKVGNEKLKTLLHKLTLPALLLPLPLSLSFLHSLVLTLLTYFSLVSPKRQLQEERKGIPGRPLRGAEVPARGGDRTVHSR